MTEPDLVAATTRDIVAAHPPFVLSPQQQWDAGLWADLDRAGLTGVGLPEVAGGSGGDLADAVTVVSALAAGAAAVPAAEHLLVAGPALLAAGLELPPVAEPMTFAVADGVTVAGDQSQWTIAGVAADVPWSSVARHLVLLVPGSDRAVLALLDTTALEATPDANLAGEPRGSFTFGEDTPAVGALMSAELADGIRARYALARAVQLSAALEQVLAWTVQYAGERHQFGRPLGRFQAVQMALAEMAGEVTAVAALIDAAQQRWAVGDELLPAAAAAKLRAGSAVEVVARHAHQVHGAMGFTQEYRLHHLTRRLWSWRDEAGSERYWAGVLGAAVLERSGGLWPTITDLV